MHSLEGAMIEGQVAKKERRLPWDIYKNPVHPDPINDMSKFIFPRAHFAFRISTSHFRQAKTPAGATCWPEPGPRSDLVLVPGRSKPQTDLAVIGHLLAGHHCGAQKFPDATAPPLGVTYGTNAPSTNWIAGSKTFCCA
jgi:hypothetical protein